MDHHTVVTVLAYLFSAVIAVPLFRKLGLGAILGYLMAGALIGPQGLHFISEPEHVLHFAEFGVVMLLFVIGLELNPEKLWNMRSQISLLGGGQLLFSALLITLFSLLVLNFEWHVSLLIGLTLGLSSTAFAVQLMDEHGIMGADLGRKGFAILLLQDLAVIPILLLVDAFAPAVSTEGEHSSLPWWLGPLAIVGVLLIGRFAINPVLKIVAQSGSREVLTAAALFIVLGTAMLMQSVGFSMGMGAFIAGIILANSSYRHQLEADIEPFKGLLLGLFFIAVGMTLDLKLLISEPLIIISLALLLMLTKTAIIALLVRIRGLAFREGILLGLMLSQGGEFAFVLMSKMLSNSVTEAWVADYVVIIVGVSMAFTAPLVMIFKFLCKSKVDESREFDKVDDENPEVIIAGFGRFGQIIGRILAANQLHFTAMDKDASHVDFVKQFGNQIYFGDATRMDLLEASGLMKARVFVVAVDDAKDSIRIIEQVKALREDIRIVARARNRMHVYQLKAVGVDHVIRETLESSLVAAEHTLQFLGYTEGQALNKVEIFRQHDEALVEKAAAHKEDMNALLDIAKEGRKELEDLFKRDETI